MSKSCLFVYSFLLLNAKDFFVVFSGLKLNIDGFTELIFESIHCSDAIASHVDKCLQKTPVLS